MFEGKLTVCENAETLARLAADLVRQTIEACVQQQGACSIALPGGATPARCLQNLAADKLPWPSLQWFMGDERCLPVGDIARNDTMIRQTLFAGNAQAVKNFHPIDAELGAETAAQRYSALVDAVGRFDLILLGMGEDGHTASLFPGNKALQDTRPAVPVFDAPKPPPERVSLGLKTLTAARQRIILVAGSNKHAALKRIKHGEQLPVNCLGESHWFIDREAAGDLFD
ncbi:MAG TPA: 6-phosphogluconolactonase [Thiotrichales bacterium]|nr:6-phosphogluconolactonase [Thiotrichales bacterium]